MGKLIGELLVEGKALTRDKLEEALKLPREAGKKLGQLLIERGYINEAQLTQALSLQLSVPWVSLYHIDFSRQLLSRVPREVAERHCLVPIYVRHVKGSGDTLYVAIEDPMNQTAMTEASKAAGLPVRPMIAAPSDIRSAIRVYYGSTIEMEALPLPPPAPASPTAADKSAKAPASGDAPERRPEPPPLPPKRKTATTLDPSQPSNPPGHTNTAAAAVQNVAPIVPIQPQMQAHGYGAQVLPPPPASRPQAQVPAAPATVPNMLATSPAAKTDPPPPDPTAPDSPDAAPELEAREIALPDKRGPRMVALTLLDGTSLALPARPRRRSEPAPSQGGVNEQLTSRDLIAALRALSHGADVSEILGDNVHWEAMFAALLSVLLRKGIIADWEFVEELQKI